MNNDDNKVSLKEIRDGFYSRRDFEISHLWLRSVFLTAFLVLCFTGYGGLLIKILDSDVACMSQILHEIACVIALIGITLSIIYIKMAKGSKAWYEVYQNKINEIEGENELGIPEKYRMGSFCKRANSWILNFFPPELARIPFQDLMSLSE